MTNEEAVEKMGELSGDPEIDHVHAEEILMAWIRAHGGEDVAAEFERIAVDFWYA